MKQFSRSAIEAKQERSRETLERILSAAERLLDSRDWDGLTMTDLAQQAGCAVGTLYGRVPNKESLLVCLYERYVRVGNAESGKVIQACAEEGLAGRAQAMCGLVVDYYSTRRGVTRAITKFLCQHPGDDVHGFRRNGTAAFKQAAAFLARAVEPAVHDDAQRASEFALLAVTELAESRIVYGDRSGIQLRFARRELTARLTHLMLAYLSSPQP